LEPGRPVPARRRRRGLRALITLTVVALLAATGTVIWRRGVVNGLALRPHCTATALGQTAELDPEQTGNAAVISAVALRRGLPGRAATIGIATAMQESKLRNISYGDRDSVGLFQQRPSQGWGTAEQIKDPVYAANAFYDVLVKVEGYQNLPITKAAQKVQRSAFPSAYADHEPEARIFASALAGYSTAALTCVVKAPATTTSVTASSAATAVNRAAKAELGLTGQITANGSPEATTVRFALTGDDLDRRAWAIAQWAVARSMGLRVTSVTVTDRTWSRSRSADGWTRSQADGALASGVVTISAG
jgi:hypothetical protein